MGWLTLVAEILSSLCVIIPLVKNLYKSMEQNIQQAKKNNSWTEIIASLSSFMTEAEKLYKDGPTKKQYVLGLVVELSEQLEYPLSKIEMEEIGILIDDFCDLSRNLNKIKEEAKAVQKEESGKSQN